MDSFPVPVCDNIRISRSRIYKGEEHRGYIASKRRYFYGLRVHIVVTEAGEPVEFLLAPGAMNDCRVLKQFDLDLSTQRSTLISPTMTMITKTFCRKLLTLA